MTWFRFKNYIRKPHNVMLIALIALMVVFILIPVIAIIARTFVVESSDLRFLADKAVGDFTTYHWWRVVASPLSRVLFYQPFLNSLYVGFGVVLLALPLGSFLAWLVTRTDIPFRRALSLLLVLPYLFPSWVMGLSWLAVFKNARIGGAPGFLQAIGVSLPDWLSYGPIPIILALTLHYYPYAFLIVSAALSSIDSRLEETASILGASRLGVLRKVTFPLVIPALGSAFILIFTKAIGTFATPAFLGLPVRFHTLATRIYSSIQTRAEGSGYVLSLFLVLVSGIAIYLNTRVLGTRKGYVTIAGQGSRTRLTKLRGLRRPIAALVILFIFLSTALPVTLLGLQTMTEHGDFNIRELSLRTWIGDPNSPVKGWEAGGILRSPHILGGAWNSVKLALTSAVICGLLGLLVGYAVVKKRGSFLSKSLESLAFVPYIIPGLVFAGIYLSMFSRPLGPIPGLYGTFAILVIVTVAKYVPFASRTGISSMLQIDQSLEEASYIHGASWIKRFRKIVIPLARSGLMAGMLLVFINAMRALSLIILLVTPKTRTLTSMTFRYVELSQPHYANAIALLIVVITLAVYFLASMLGKAKIERIG